MIRFEQSLKKGGRALQQIRLEKMETMAVTKAKNRKNMKKNGSSPKKDCNNTLTQKKIYE